MIQSIMENVRKNHKERRRSYMTKKKRGVSLLLIVFVTVCILAGVLFSMPSKTANTVYASRDSNGTNTDGEWTGTQDTPNLIPTLKDGSIATQGWKVGSDGNTKVAANTVHESNSLGWVIKSSGNGTDLGAYGYTGGVYYTLTLSEADRVKANAGQLYVSGEAGFYVQMWAKARYSIRVEFYNSGGAQISKEGTTHEGSSGWGDATDTWGLGWIKVPVGTCTIQVWFSNHNTLDGRPYIANPSCSLHDITPPSDTGLTLESPNTSGVIAGDTIRYCIGFNEKVSISSKGTATITLNGTSYNSTDAVIETVGGKSKACYTFKLPDVNQSGTIKLSSVSGLVVKDEAGNTYTYNNSNPSVPTQQYYKTMNVSCSPAHLKFSGGGTAKFNHDYTATLSAVRGYNLPETITVKVGGRALSQGSDFTYDARTGEIKVKGGNITDNITISASGVPKKSGVTLHKESGVGGSESTTATFDAPMPAIDVPTRTGYTFQGYFTASGGAGTKYYDAAGHSAKVCDFDAPIDLYAHWTANHYSITFDQNKPSKASASVQGNMSNESRIYDEGAKALTKNTFTLTGWTFQGWATTAGDGQVVTYQDTVSVENLTPDPNGTYTLYAVWKQNTYTITLEPMGGTNAGTGSATYDDTLPDITVPEKYGYNFLGYFDRETDGTKYYEANGNKALTTYTVVGEITLYAHWAPITYIIRLYNDGNFVRDIPDVVYGTLQLPTAEECGLSRKNFDFVGWNIYAEQDWKMYSPGVVYATGLTGTQGDIVVLNASWQERPIHSLFYDANGGYSAPAAERLHEGEGTTIGKSPVREDYTFAGWSLAANSDIVRYQEEDPFTMESGDVTLYAVWKHNPSLTYDANEGQFTNHVAESYPAAGAEVTVTELKPTREGYTFLGWATDAAADRAEYSAKGTFLMPEENTVLYAVWQKKEFTVSQSVAGSCHVSGLEEEYPYGEEVTFTVTGDEPKVYVNGTLLFDDGAGNYTFTVTGNVSIVIADSSSCVLLYSANGGEDAPTDTQFYASNAEATVSDEIPTRTGYQFVGWSKNKNASTESISGRSNRIFTGGDDTLYQADDTVTFNGNDVTLYAIWKANTYTVKYNGMGADGSMTESAHSYGTAKALENNGFTKTGYNFIGWALSEGGTPVFADGDEVLNLTADNGAEVTLYAVWETMKTVITFDAAGGGGGSASYLVEYGQTLPMSGIMAPVYSGYTFAGYFTEENGAGTPYFDATMRPVGDAANVWTETAQKLTLYAYWIPTTETLEKSVDEVQENLETATYALYSALGDSEESLRDEIEQLKAAYAAADALLKGQLQGEDSRLEGKIDGLKTTLEAADDAIKDTIESLEERLNKKIADLQAKVDRDETDIAGLQKALTQLEADYQAADTAVRSDFAKEDTRLEGLIDALEIRLKAADDVLQTTINRVEGKLDKAVEDLQKAIADNKGEIEDELAKLKEAYEAADLLINGEIVKLQAKDSALSQSIADLESAYQAADRKLQDAIDAVEKKLDKAVEDLQAAIEANETDIEAKVSALDTAYQNADALLRSDMTEADGELDSKITSLQNAMTTADGALQDAIDAVEKKLDKAVKDLQAAIEANETDIEQKVSDLGKAYEAADTLINSEIAVLQSQDLTLSESIAILESTCKAADRKLQDAIDAVEKKLDKAVEDLQAAIKANETDIEAKVSALDSAYQTADTLINSEIAELKSQDLQLAKSIAILESTYKAADKGLQEAIDAVEAKLDKAVEELQKAIEANETDIEAKVSAMDSAYQAADALLRSDMTEADGKLESKITALESAVTTADDALQTAIDAVEKKLDKAVEDLQAAIEANETDIEAKVSALDTAYQTADSLLRSDMTEADEELEAKITALQNAMATADDALQVAIDAVEKKLDKAVEDLQASIAANETDIEAKVSALDTAYQNADALLRSDMTEADDALEAKINALENAMNAIDSTLQTAIKTVQDNLDKAVEDLQASIEANETDIESKVSAMDSAYQAADVLLRSDMTEADGALEAKINALQNAMTTADDALQAAINKVQADLDKAVEELQKAIGANGSDVEAKVSAMNSAYRAADALINSDIAGLKAQDSALAQSIAALDSAYQAADEALWQGIRQVEGKHDALQEENEKTEFIYMIVNYVLGGVAAVLIVTLVVKIIKKKKTQQ